MELRHLRYFVAIAEEASFTRAADRLWIAQPGLSTQMRRLETELGVQLLTRHPRGVTLTDAGELFLERARAVLDAVELASATGRDLHAGVVGRLRLGIAVGMRWRGTSTLLAEFSRQYPGVDVTVVESEGGALWADLRERRLDAVVASVDRGSGDLQCLRLADEPWVVLVGRGHPLAARDSLVAQDLQGVDIAVSSRDEGDGEVRALGELLAKLDVKTELVRGAPGPGLLRAAADGSALVLTTAPEALPHDVVVRPLVPAQTISLALLWRQDTVSPALAKFIRLARRRAQDRAEPGPLLDAAA